MLLKSFFKSMALCWLFSLVTTLILLYFNQNDYMTVYPFQGTLSSTSSSSSARFLRSNRISQLREDLQSSSDLHEMFVHIISSSYDLYTGYLMEILLLSVTIEIFPHCLVYLSPLIPSFVLEFLALLKGT